MHRQTLVVVPDPFQEFLYITTAQFEFFTLALKQKTHFPLPSVDSESIPPPIGDVGDL